MEILVKESKDDFATSRLAEERKILDKRMADLLSSIASLFHREKGYFEQNPVYKRNIYDLILNLRVSWIHLYEYAKTWHKKSVEKHKRDNDEITNFVGE